MMHTDQWELQKNYKDYENGKGCEYWIDPYSVTVNFRKLDKETVDIALWKLTQMVLKKESLNIYFNFSYKIEASQSNFNGIKYFQLKVKEKFNKHALFDSGYHNEIACRY